MTSNTVTSKQLYRINEMITAGVITVNQMPTEKWEASWIIRTAPASKRDKEALKNTGGRVLTRMTTGELEMTTKVLSAIDLIAGSRTKDEKVLEALTLLRNQFVSSKAEQ